MTVVSLFFSLHNYSTFSLSGWLTHCFLWPHPCFFCILMRYPSFVYLSPNTAYVVHPIWLTDPYHFSYQLPLTESLSSSLSWFLFISRTYLDLIIGGWWEVWRVEITRVTETRQWSGNCECKSPWHSLKQRRKEGDSDHNYSSVRCEDEEDLSFYTLRTHTHL